MTRRFFAASTLAAGFARAETSGERGKKIIDRAVAALGGPNFLAMQDRLESGRAYSFYREELSGLSIAKIYTRYPPSPRPPAPDYFAIQERESFGKKKEDSAILFTDGNGYELTYHGVRPLADNLVERYKESTLHNIFYILRQRLGEPGLQFESKGQDVVENQPVEILDIFDAQNRSVTVYLNSNTFFPTKQRFYRRDAVTKDRVEEISRFSKYRDVGNGVMWPLDIQRDRDGEKIFEIYADSVSIGNHLKDSLFLLPSGMKILKKES
ncbi:MAG: hypothetical protein M3Z23_14015 [Acidobacteriota bacterium]|nr:hypothetical protein [Acidobacteriota bacterium]